jgi:hypothetical protein
MNVTKRNHYNPCFWTAFWNRDYYDASLHGSPSRLIPREQVVYALNVKSGSIRDAKVDDVHFDKNLGFAEITFESAKKFCKRHHPDKYDDFCRNSRNDQYPVYIDFEDILSKFEDLPPYRILLDVVKRQDLTSRDEKAFLASFIYLQWLRSHAIMNAAIEWGLAHDVEKFEHFVLLKWALSTPEFLYAPVAQLVSLHWTFYRTDEDTFPLTDSPILMHEKSVVIALSPRLLLKLTPGTQADEDTWYAVNHIQKSKIEEFRRLTIENTFREIIFSDRNLLERWKNSAEFQRRAATIREMKSYTALITKRKGERFRI